MKRILQYARTHRLITTVAVLAVLISCGTPIVKSMIEVRINPGGIIHMTSGARQKFTAAVTGVSNTAVTWAVTAGKVDATGLFTAPAVTTVTTIQIVATSVADSSAFSQAQIIVNPPPAAPLPVIGSFTTSKACTFSGAVLLTWATTNATSATITTNAGGVNTIQPVSANGTLSVTPTVTTTYTLTATNAIGSVTQQLVVTVALPMVIHASDPATGVEQLPAGGPFTVPSGGNLQFWVTGGC